MHVKFEDLSGQRFGKWRVLAYHDKRSGHYRWNCRCDCGAEHVVWQHSLRERRSLGCKACVIPHVKHGYEGTPTYTSYRHMLDRCLNPNDKNWPKYGGRDITVCRRWRGENGFANFLADMGERPAGTSLDRKFGYDDYRPRNCRWATSRQQNRNREPRSPKSPNYLWWMCSRVCIEP